MITTPTKETPQQKIDNFDIFSFRKITDSNNVITGIIPYINETLAIVVKKNADIKHIIPAVDNIDIINSPFVNLYIGLVIFPFSFHKKIINTQSPPIKDRQKRVVGMSVDTILVKSPAVLQDNAAIKIKTGPSVLFI